MSTRFFRKPKDSASHFEVEGGRPNVRAERVYANGDRFATRLSLSDVLSLVEIRELEEITREQTLIVARAVDPGAPQPATGGH